MKMKKLVSVGVSSIVAASLISACGSDSENNENSDGNEGQSSSEATNIQFSLDQPSEHVWVEAVNDFADRVEEKTDGSVTVDVNDSGSLGSQREALEGMQVGSMGGTVSLEPVSSIVEEIGLFGVPYLFEDENHLEAFLTGDPGEELDQLMIDEGLRPLTYFTRAPRQVTSNTEINNLEDFNGLSIRVPESPTAPPAFEAMGAQPTTMPLTEVYSALQQNVIDAQENPITQIYSDGFYEVQDYVSITNHQYQAGYLLMSEDIYQNLSDEERSAIQEAASETQEFESEALQEEVDTAYEELEAADIQFTEPDTEPFAEAASEAYSEYDEVIQEWIERAQNVE